MHPQVIGRGHRMLMLERLTAHIADHDGAVFETIGQYVDRWRSVNPLDGWKASHPGHAVPGTRGARR